eukprot:6207450-Pleurochrysis_carterae.AAC.1
MSDPASGKVARRAAQQPTQTKEAPGSKAHLVRYDGDVVSIGNGRFSINALRHKLSNDVCLPVALSRKPNPLAVCDCHDQPGHGLLGHGVQKIPRSARAVADAARLRSSKRITPQPADGERTSQRQRQARANTAAEAQRLMGDLGEVVRAVLESVSIGAPHQGGRGRPTLPHAPPFSPALHLPQQPYKLVPGLPPPQQPVGKGKGRGMGGRGIRGRGDTPAQLFH